MAATESGSGRDKYCGGRKRAPEGGTCTRPAGWGTPHVGIGRCKLHGGSTPTNLIAAQRIQAAELAERYSVPREVHPLTGVMEQYHRYAGQVAYLEARVNELPPEDLFWGVTEETDRRDPDGEDQLRTGSAAEFEQKRKAGPNALLEQFDKVQRDYAKLGVDIIKIGVESTMQAAANHAAPPFVALVLGLLDDVAAKVTSLHGGDPAELVRMLQPLAVARVAALAGVGDLPIEGQVA